MKWPWSKKIDDLRHDLDHHFHPDDKARWELDHLDLRVQEVEHRIQGIMQRLDAEERKK